MFAKAQLLRWEANVAPEGHKLLWSFQLKSVRNFIDKTSDIYSPLRRSSFPSSMIPFLAKLRTTVREFWKASEAIRHETLPCRYSTRSVFEYRKTMISGVIS
jgi:hypothetical protein